ncbi:MAG: SDR family NAD(P)-dependent oxidoreductase [Methylobacteriaceae bacterium]|nr:SDR family NAD(P)-dependent oxidoreductase [Methylobacteriaceae bacterium]
MSPAAPSLLSTRPVLVTGGAGFIGVNLADRLAREGYSVLIFDSLARPGVDDNLQWLKSSHADKISFACCDVRDRAALGEAVRDCRAVFHFAAQVAVTTSLIEPRVDFDVNVGGTISLLESLRLNNPRAPLLFSSTNKVYGNLDEVELEREEDHYLPKDARLRAHGVDEHRPLDFHTPYGCSKGAADQYVLDYARSFGLLTAVMRMSCIYGPHQMGTEDQGWVAHFVYRALAGEPITIYGDGCQVRDVLHVGDAVEAYLAAWRNIGRVAGRPFNLGGGPANAVSLKRILRSIESRLGRPVGIEFADWRAGDQRYYVSDTRAIMHELELRAPKNWESGVAELITWISERKPSERKPARALGAARQARDHA